MSQDRLNKTLLLGAVGIIFFAIAWNVSAPAHFPTNILISIPDGAGLNEIATILKEDNLIRSTFWFKVSAVLLDGEHGMMAGEYAFDKAESTPHIAWRIRYGMRDIATEKITVPEGFTVKKISTLFGPQFRFFDHTLFERTAPEGYLFPDTYFIPDSATASTTIKLMHDNFVRKIFTLTPAIEVLGHSIEQIVTMASLLEAEAKTATDRAMVADILWKRLKLGMPLQVDSEMGTYSFQGLPGKPIDNPGLVSLQAAIHPIKTPYLYFLSDKNGVMHYARTFDEHQANIQKYLSN